MGGRVAGFFEGEPGAGEVLEKLLEGPKSVAGPAAIAGHVRVLQFEACGQRRAVQDRLKALESDAELGPIVEDIKKNGMEAAMKHLSDEELMLKVSRKMGGIPAELQGMMRKSLPRRSSWTPRTTRASPRLATPSVPTGSLASSCCWTAALISSRWMREATAAYIMRQAMVARSSWST